MKPYNSFCVDTLHIGHWSSNPSSMAGLTGTEQKNGFKSFLTHHGLSFQAFDQLYKGAFSPRVHIPFPSQIYRGRVRSLRCQREDQPDTADVIEIEADLGMGTFVLEASRDVFFVFGHWMGKADLRYVLDRGNVYSSFRVAHHDLHALISFLTEESKFLRVLKRL